MSKCTISYHVEDCDCPSRRPKGATKEHASQALATAQLLNAAPDLLEMLKQALVLMPLGTAKRATWFSLAGDAVRKAEGR